MNEQISITGLGSISALGSEFAEIYENYQNPKHFLKEEDFGKFSGIVSSISDDLEQKLEEIRNSDPKYKSIDKSVLFAIFCARNAVKQANWNISNFGINVGSSRGATELFEKFHEEFTKHPLGKTNTLSSPTTTLGNIASWIAHDLQTEGPTISHSIACSTALHSILNGIAWIQSGMSDAFLVGGTEASNTPFTVSQMKALKIYAEPKKDYPVRTLDFEKEKNGMVIGEGAAMMCLEKGKKENALAYIEGVGYATEVLKHNVSISTNADCFQKSMKMALKGVNPEEIDCIVMHAPGTKKGDSSEFNAIEKIFGEKKPALTSNKWKIGHTLGASGALSMELAILMLQTQEFITIPFLSEQKIPNKINKILVNAVGFGGNAVSILLARN
ncbi:beta-ketoacyl synthase N-terminal-like domain-containing protein [Aureivirga sp. CE67]|uniref:beta-ketoacyl synthase N-terminal-like domain-containing protein n=1 Tax=Aureivirga sp. CE67 TaxID=1788983 RepID=UPI0018C9B242|nr:beta-ketoacyl synthase N-terminal-like domain-containing protein [Aureivirga sp. CE67]